MIPSPVLEIKQLSFSYGHSSILNQLNLSLKKNEIMALIGASGSGKSTLFKLISGLLNPSQGTVAIYPMADSLQRVTYMMQQDFLLPWRTVMDNILLPLELGKKKPIHSQVRQDVTILLQSMGLQGKENCFPDELSGGMKQRVALARALICKPTLLLLDEPFGSLDVLLREQLYTLLHRICQTFNTTFLLVTHDFHDAIALADRILLLAAGHIQKEWQVTPTIRQDYAAVGQLKDEIKFQLNRFSSANH